MSRNAIFIVSSQTSPPLPIPPVPIHFVPFSSMAIELTVLLGNPEFEVLKVVQFVPSNAANPPM